MPDGQSPKEDRNPGRPAPGQPAPERPAPERPAPGRPAPELLAPAGTPRKLEAAFHFGADAAYLGLKEGSLRAFAGNFTLEELEWALGYARARQKRIYVCLNLQPFDDDLDRVGRMLRDLARLRPDGLIVADPGVVELARQLAPSLPLHLSTQASVTNAAAARFWFTQGVTRIVVARELSLDRIRQVVDGAPPRCEIEVFAHGAVCVAYSGRCLLSLYWAGRNRKGERPERDPRRGSCAQGCRWAYSRMAVEDARRPGQWNPVEEDERGTYFFDAKDLCALPLLDELVSTGVRSLKLEGRTRSIHSVAVTVDVYRHALDRLAAGDREGFLAEVPRYLDELARPAYRGFSTHFLGGDENALSSYNPEGSYRDGRAGYLGDVVAADPEGLWVQLVNPLEPGAEVEVRDAGLLCERARVERLESRDGALLGRALSGSVIRIPGRFRALPGALVRPMLSSDSR
ncbi:MAG: peptidase U32 family protein [Polyangia bacterium]|jgi:putative protease|nr:peptidase U32 family protein [Polyangia bacterium]